MPALGQVQPIADRLERHSDRTGVCWIWTGARDRRGYGFIGVSGKMLKAHRVSYENYVGPIPAGLTLDHLCGVTSCIRPSHLEPVTMTENIRRGTSPSARNRQKDACVRGHPFTPENTYIPTSGRRVCRQCSKERRLEYNAPACARCGQPWRPEFTVFKKDGRRQCARCFPPRN